MKGRAGARFKLGERGKTAFNQKAIQTNDTQAVHLETTEEKKQTHKKQEQEAQRMKQKLFYSLNVFTKLVCRKMPCHGHR